MAEQEDPVLAGDPGHGEVETESAAVLAGFAARTVSPVRAGDLIAERYLVEAELGEGGGGTVYQAFDRAARAHVALKVLSTRNWNGSFERPYRELRAGRAINHPNVCRIFDVIEDDGRWILTMEYASAGTLRATLKEGAGRPVEEKVADGRAIVAGLAAIHRAGLIHRDLKPENILRMADGRLAVSDFGLAREIEQTTFTTGIAGTPGYLAPETMIGARPSQGSDVWALGIILHELLVGRRPERAGSRPVPRPEIGKQGSRATRALARACVACLEPNPRRRPDSAVEVERRLERGQDPMRLGKKGWAAVSAALATVAVTVALLSRSTEPTPDTVARPPEVADWSHAPILIKGESGGSGRWQVLPPERRMLRVLVRPRNVIDVEINTGKSTPSPIDPETWRGFSFPMVSPDGKSMLWTRRRDGRDEVMYSERPDGRNGRPLLAGRRPIWLPNGEEFLFVTESVRLARGNLKGEATVLAQGGPTPYGLMDIVADDRGELAAASFMHRFPVRETRLELFDLRSMKNVSGWTLPFGLAGMGISYNSRRQAFQTAIPSGADLVMADLTAGKWVPIAATPGMNLVYALPADGGLVLSTYDTKQTRRLLIHPGGSESLIGDGTGDTDVSHEGDVVYVGASDSSTNRDGIVLQRKDSSRSKLADGPGLGGPNISDDGKSVVYYGQDTGEVFLCTQAKGMNGDGCSVVYVDKDLHFLPRPGQIGPDGESIPYFARDPNQNNGTIHFRVLSLRTGRARDLGPVDVLKCPVLWASPTTVWLHLHEASEWTELDIQSGRPTTRTAPVNADTCLPTPPSIRSPYWVRYEVGWNIRFLRDPPYPPALE